MPDAPHVMRFRAPTVSCSEAIDWEIVRVTFDTEADDFDEENRTSPYLSISANFEFSDAVQIEFHDGDDYSGGYLREVDLWRNKVRVLSRAGDCFEIDFELSDTAFTGLREYLKVLMQVDVSRESGPAEQAAALDG